MSLPRPDGDAHEVPALLEATRFLLVATEQDTDFDSLDEVFVR